MKKNVLQDFDMIGFQDNLVQWYQENKRDLPWRNSQDPYKIWVSEIMLQQTRVDTVIPYFIRFINKYPTIYDLANADSQDVLKQWEGLGYYSRVRNLHHAAKEVVATYNGHVPNEPKKLGALKGIGPYTRGAILSIAFDQPEPAVDGNVMRVISRVLQIDDNTSEPRVKKDFEKYVREMIAKKDPSSFNQGIMELGALVCTPKTPQCHVCPVQKYCRAYENGVVDQLPIKAKPKKQKILQYLVVLIKNANNEYIIEQRPETGLLADLWQFPMIPVNEVKLDGIENWIDKHYGLKIVLGEKKGELKHVFTHIIWDLEIFEANTLQVESVTNDWKFVHRRDLRSYPFPVSHLNMMNLLSQPLS